MKKAIFGFAAVGALVGLFPVAIRISRKMRDHSEEMAVHCKQMAAQCRQMAAQAGRRGEAVGSAQRPRPPRARRRTSMVASIEQRTRPVVSSRHRPRLPQLQVEGRR